MVLGEEAHRLLKKMYRDKDTDTFVCGLRGALPRIFGAHAHWTYAWKRKNLKYRTMHAVTLEQASNKSATTKPLPAPGFRQPPQVLTNKSYSLKTTTTLDSSDNSRCHDNTTETNTDSNSSHNPGQ